jgi:predicted aldo/keto reductase-like oxidoreductase
MPANNTEMTRRELGRTAAFAGGAVAASAFSASGAAPPLERRPLGKTGIEVGLLGIGTSPLGQPGVTQKEVNHVIAMAADEGVNYLDAAPIYGMAERRLGPALKGKRDKFVLISKVEATSKQDATWQMKESLHKMQTDYLDVVHIHNVGRTDRFPDLDVLTGEDGALQALRDAKKEGLIRHIGLTCHLRPTRALPIIETGEIELVMCAANFVDVHTYNFEGTVFAAAEKRGMGVVAMKILGGTDGDHAKLSADEHYTNAVRYALGIPGLSVAIMGIKNTTELEKALATVRAYKPFTNNELTQINQKGKTLAKASDWGELRGPVAWDGDRSA